MRKLFYTMMIAALTVANGWAQESVLPTITLKTAKGKGETIHIGFEASETDRKDIWIDLDGNGVRNPDGSEELQENTFGIFTYGAEYTIQVPAGNPITIYGHMNKFSCNNVSPYYDESDKSNNRITELDFSNASEKLTEIYCAQNEIKALNVSKLANLELLDCTGNKELSELNLNNNKKLIDLNCSSTNLKTLDVSNNKELEFFSCPFTPIETINVTLNEKLKTLNCNNCKSITSLDVSKNIELLQLNCDGCNITALDVTQNTKLFLLYCEDNREIKELDVSKCLDLKYLRCSNNSIGTLNVENNTSLLQLHCEKNGINELDVTKNTLLNQLYCSKNSLTSLDLSKNKKLTDLKCVATNMDACALNTMYESLPSLPEKPTAINLNIWELEPSKNNKAVATSNTKIATGKNWNIYKEGDGTGCQPNNIDLQESNNVVSVYPNPATDYITVSLPDSAQGGTLVIADLSGKTVVAEPITDTQINVSIAHLAKGVYIVKVGSTVEKLIVK